MFGEKPKYPAVQVNIPTEGPGAYAPAVLGAVIHAMRCAGIPQSERAVFLEQAQGRSYQHILRVIREWVSVE